MQVLTQQLLFLQASAVVASRRSGGPGGFKRSGFGVSGFRDWGLRVRNVGKWKHVEISLCACGGIWGGTSVMNLHIEAPAISSLHQGPLYSVLPMSARPPEC